MASSLGRHGRRREPYARCRRWPDHTAFAYEHFPPILTPTETGTIRIVAEVVGDVSSVVFRRNVPTEETGYSEELWRRSTTRTVDGRLVSVFDQDYPGATLVDLLLYPHGNDFPQVPLGRLEVPVAGNPNETSAGASFVTIWLRLAPSNLPVSTVRVSTAPDPAVPAQYASHVVNLVVPGFGDSQVLNGAQAFELAEAAQAFYQHFADTYHTLSFIPRRSPLASYTAFNLNVKNDVEGIGAALIDDQAVYGSETLRSVQIYTAGFAGQHETTVHQTAHHWGDETNLAAIAGVAAAGHQPESHTPLLGGGATLIGAVLKGTREVERVSSTTVGGDDTYRIARTTAPITFHSLQLYRMGLLEPAAVSDVTVFGDQAQFSPSTATAPTVGTPVTGEPHTVNINQVMAALGTRRGPSFTEWRQAFVVVSDELISQREMDYYNFYAQRAEGHVGHAVIRWIWVVRPGLRTPGHAADGHRHPPRRGEPEDHRGVGGGRPAVRAARLAGSRVRCPGDEPRRGGRVADADREHRPGALAGALRVHHLSSRAVRRRALGRDDGSGDRDGRPVLRAAPVHECPGGGVRARRLRLRRRRHSRDSDQRDDATLRGVRDCPRVVVKTAMHRGRRGAHAARCETG